MAFLGYSEDFDLDDDGILRDSTESGGILIDDDGIVRDDFDLLSKHGSSTHWTDSGLGGDKAGSTPSTLRQLDLQSYPSFEDVSRNYDDDISRNFDDDVSRNFDESNVNISDLEASKDDLSFDDDYDKGVRDKDFYGDVSRSKGTVSGLSSRSSFDHSLNYDDSHVESVGGQESKEQQGELFSDEYYRQLQELGVLVDHDDILNPRESLNEFESLEHHYSRDFEEEDKVGDAIDDFLKRERQTPTRDSMDIEMPDDRNESKSGLFDNSQGYDDNYYERGEYVNEDRRTRPNTASSTRTISSRSFPEISPEEALELYGGGKPHIDGDSFSLTFDQTHSQRTDDDEIYFIPSQEHDKESPTPAKIPAYDIENKPSITPKHRGHRLDRSRSDRSDRSRSDRSSEGSRSVTPQSESQYVDQEDGGYSEGSRSVTPQPEGQPGGQLQEEGGYHSEDRNDSLTQVSRLDSRRDPTDTDSFRPDSALSELSSAASEGRAARPKTQRVTKKPPKQKSNLSHAKSEQSFFDMEMTGTKRVEKGPKRLLPKPAPGEESQSFKVKSKSTTNIAALGGPVKPTHMSLSEIRNIAIDDEYEVPEPDHAEAKSQASDVPKGELTQKLRQESSKRQQATQLVKQLQEDYDKLLSKYALAELTIDQMRLGSKITLHAASPTPSQATSGSLQSAQHLQLLQLSAAQRGMVAPSPQHATPTMFFPEGFQPPGEGDGRQVQQRGTSPAVLPRSDSTNSMDSCSTPRGEVEQPGGIANDAEKVKLGLLFQARNLDERMQSFSALLGDGQLTVEEQEGVFDKIRVNHEKLRSDYLQSKEDYTALRRSTPAAADLNFDQEKELEGELFKLGMKFDEIQENVEENVKQKSATRQPFQGTRRDSSDSGADSGEGDPATENMKKRMTETRAGADLLEPRDQPELQEKFAKLQEEYNALMARYRRIREMASSRDRDKEIDNLVKKLTKICDEEPKMFKLPAELQERTEKKVADSKPATTEKRRLPEPKSARLAAANSAGKSPAKSYEILTASETWSLAESMDRWERSKQLDEAADRSRSRDNLNTSTTSSTPGRSHTPSKRVHDEPDSRLKPKDRTGSYNSISSRGRNTPDSGRGRHTPDLGKGRHSPDSTSARGHHSPDSTSARGRYSPDSSRGRHTPDSSYNDRNSPVPSLPRPRRHDYPDRERRERRDLKKSQDWLGESTGSSIATDSGLASLATPRLNTQKPEGGSTTSLQDSGISEHEGATGPNSPLSKLPGPGKFKQMTGRREPDTDSGFIGSMVGSEVSAGNLSTRRQPQQAPLRLRHGGDSARPSSRQSNRSDDSAAATTPRSARSQASSRSSRQTPTKAFPFTDTKQQQQQDTKPEARTKTPSKEGSRSKSRDQVTQHSRDYTDDSYTSVTESEVSFDSDMRARRRHSHGSRRNSAQRHIDKIAEDSEEENYSVDPTLNETTDINLSWVTSDSERASMKQSKRQLAPQQTPKKKQQESPAKPASAGKRPGVESKPQSRGRPAPGPGQQRQGRASRMTTDDETTTTMSTLSPTRVDTTADLTQDTTDDTYTSDGTTPRSVIERERKAAKQKSAQKTDVKKQASPGAQIPPRTITPVQASRSEVHPGQLYASQDQGPVLKAPSHRPNNYMDRSIGSAADETILASDAETAVTRGSINSQRLKLLSSEIDKLREEFVRSNKERQQQQAAPVLAPPPPPPPQQQQQGYYDQYFDPTEDPLAFMRGPRRRANSFSGHGERNWDYDWQYGANRDGDIPLGYAAADAYATPRQRQDKQQEDGQVEEDPTRSRGRRRLRRRISQRNAGTQPTAEQNGYDSDQSPTRVGREESTGRVAGQYAYLASAGAPVAAAQQAPQQGSLQQGRRVFGSQPNLQYFGYQPPPPAGVHSEGSDSTPVSGLAQQRPLRHTLYSYAANPNQNQPPSSTQYPHLNPNQRQYASDDIYVSDGQTRFLPHGASDVGSEGVGRGERGVYTSTCPLCGSTSSHTHGEFAFPPPDSRQPLGYLLHDGRAIVDTVLVPVYALPTPMLPVGESLAAYSPLPSKPSIQFATVVPAHPAPAAPASQLHQAPVAQSPVPPPPAHPPGSLHGGPPPPPLAPPPSRPPVTFKTVTPHSSSDTSPVIALLPFRMYKASSPLKPRFYSFRLPNKLRVPAFDPSHPPPPRSQPMAARHDITPQPFIKLVESVQKEGRRAPRARSRSWGRQGRIRHYSPDGHVRSRYFVREFGDVESDSAESETEELPRPRSRSVGRRKARHGRKYKRVRSHQYDDEGGLSRLSKPQSATSDEMAEQIARKSQDKGDNSNPAASAAAVDDLDRSLRLVDEIDHLTHKMMGTVGDELATSKRHKDFGSSYW